MSTAWTDDFYDAVFARWYMATRPRSAILAAADFIERALALPRPARIFDQCCGIGQLALVLAERGHEVYGIDRSARYVAAARYLAERDRRSARFEACDAGSARAPLPCTAAISWYTSFGVAGDDRPWLERINESLEPGGGLILDVGNRTRVTARFVPRMLTTLRGPEGEVHLVRDSVFDRESGIMRQTWRFTFADGSSHQRDSVVRIYHRDELAELLVQSGLRPTHWYGSSAGEPLGDDSERCIVVARKA